MQLMALVRLKFCYACCYVLWASGVDDGSKSMLPGWKRGQFSIVYDGRGAFCVRLYAYMRGLVVAISVLRVMYDGRDALLVWGYSCFRFYVMYDGRDALLVWEILLFSSPCCVRWQRCVLCALIWGVLLSRFLCCVWCMIEDMLCLNKNTLVFVSILYMMVEMLC